MCMRWGLTQVLHVSGGHDACGLISWDMYIDWSEAKLGKLTASHVLPLNTDFHFLL